jgi:DNA repair protein RecN (Recombination protein N)
VLASLSIKNFALIEDLEVSFASGLCMLTGETGSGKSILLNALSLILGQRADLSTIRSGATKCIVEAVFDISRKNLSSLFEALDLDEESETVVRRELSASGKSRAFVNDTPVTLDALKTLGAALVDIHTQRQTIQLTDSTFYLSLLDHYSGGIELVSEYKTAYTKWQQVSKELDQLLTQQQQANQALDYHQFLLQELEQVKLSSSIIRELEEEAKILRNATGLRSTLAEVRTLSTQEQLGVQDQLLALKQLLAKISSLGDAYQSLHERISSLGIEFSDIVQEAELLAENIADDPSRLQQLEDELSILHHLCQKHQVLDANGLIEKRETLRKQCGDVVSMEQQIDLLKDIQTKALQKLKQLGDKLRNQRQACCNPLAQDLVGRTKALGMEHVQFSVKLIPLDTPGSLGTEEVALWFSANKGIDFAPLSKVASGGELSRIMLVIKSILSEKIKLPTLVLDEIDTGVSGEMANAMGKRMHEMSRNMQVISITHLPQIAALADAHYKVYKQVVGEKTQTFLRPLSEEERINELAEMLGGKNKKESALRHARELRNV